MEKIFQTKLRNVKVEIREDYIEFSLPEEDGRQFYAIPKKEWIADKTSRLDRDDNWRTHMMEKTWFSKEMKDFIDNNA